MGQIKAMAAPLPPSPYIGGSNYILKMGDFKRGPPWWDEIWDGPLTGRPSLTTPPPSSVPNPGPLDDGEPAQNQDGPERRSLLSG